MNTPIRSYSLYELVASVRRCIEASYIDLYWVRAETTSLTVNSSSGHCYLELEEKDEGRGVKARIRANIWRQQYEAINQKLRNAGLSPLSSGMNILCQVQLKYHELYGISLIIHDIDPNYSLGEIARQRLETIERLKRDGVFADNKRHSLPTLIQRLAIISSPTAAGYGDFMNQLHQNAYGLRYYTALFQAQMQGDNTTKTVIVALNRVAEYLHEFDAVVIIRGGGSVSDLRAFDDYHLAYYCTQYPLPIIAGIGHDRDTSVLDMVAHTSLKTPTAVAEYLIQQQLTLLSEVNDLQLRLGNATYIIQTERQRRLTELSLRIPHLASRQIHEEEQRQAFLRERLISLARKRIELSKQEVETSRALLPRLVRQQIVPKEQQLSLVMTRLSPSVRQHCSRYNQLLSTYEQAIRLAHPDNILKRGFALIKQNDKTIKSADKIKAGDIITIQWFAQEMEATVR